MNKVIFDLEATCEENNRNFRNEIIEIGAVKINDKNEIVDEFDIFVKPKLNKVLSDFFKTLTTIEQEDIDNAVEFPKAIQKFRDWIGNENFVLCSWGFYDKKQIKVDCELHKIANPFSNSKHISLKHQHGDIVGQRPMGMGKALKLAKIKLDGTHHRGIDDAKNIAKIYLKYVDRWNFDGSKI